MKQTENHEIRIRKPKWLKKRLPRGPEYGKMTNLLADSCLATVCQEAQCPNQFECFSKGTATFMIMGERCTRNCRFCAVSYKPIGPPDPEEPGRIADAVATLGLKYAVVTSVTRDDLPDGGASHFKKVLTAIAKKTPGVRVEILIPDLQGNWEALAVILEGNPTVLNHNVETVPRLYERVRPEAVYSRSLRLLQEAKRIRPDIPSKSGIMVGLGETRDEILSVMKDLRTHDCDILTLGQYLQPSRAHLPVDRFVTPEEFIFLKEQALKLGFKAVASSPTVRSSFEAGILYEQVIGAVDRKN
ncbi:lipoyl synthase [Desulforhopalus singaporensis]|uniref:Lipoyl synthase n=1 Tax=Desulforhopalus singaporensis TaxID=91360 RepID=A0A1H0PSU9_9BACT|nr:lipoyl synthase [Desulforhopalus singaporensis]SDP08074.1 lipoic acid synthetase [Desulforhopalus singaporensis]